MQMHDLEFRTDMQRVVPQLSRAQVLNENSMPTFFNFVVNTCFSILVASAFDFLQFCVAKRSLILPFITRNSSNVLFKATMSINRGMLSPYSKPN